MVKKFGPAKSWKLISGGRWHESTIYENLRTGDQLSIQDVSGLPNRWYLIRVIGIHTAKKVGKGNASFTKAKREALSYMRKHP
jgi:hypothetical protein